jgi:hypothetical protein
MTPFSEAASSLLAMSWERLTDSRGLNPGEHLELSEYDRSKAISASLPNFSRKNRQMMTLNPLSVNHLFVTYRWLKP